MEEKRIQPSTEKKTSVEVSALIKITKTREEGGKVKQKDTDTLEVNLNLHAVEEVTRQVVRGIIMGAADAAAKTVVGDGIGESDGFEDPK